MKSSLFCFLFLLCLCDSLTEDVLLGMSPTMVEKEHRKSLMVSEYGEISAVNVKGGRKGSQHLEFMTLEPNSLFLPVLLHVDMVSYVDTGSGKLSWSAEGESMKRINIKRGDVYRLHAGSVFFLQSNLETERQKLRIYSIFSNTDEDLYVPSIGAYSSISDLVLGFDWRLLQSAFKVPEVVIKEMKSASRPPAIVHALPDKKKSIYGEIGEKLIKVLTGKKDGLFYKINGGSKKTKTFNILEVGPDFENCNGWSVSVDRKDLKYLKGSNIGVFMVNLTKGSMMGPHWNPRATEIAIVLQGEGMVRMVCASNANETECKNRSFRVKEGDVFATPRFYPMAQMSFNNDSFVFMGFSTSTRTNYPQFLAGKRSVLQTLNKDILALSFNVTNSTIDALLTHQEEAIILDCTSCAEEEEIKMERERQEEEARKREEERKKEQEERKREEREAAERERRERERKEAEEREEEERRRREERAKREQEEARRQEEERQREQREKEEAARKEREREEEERQREQREKEEAARKEREREEGGGGGGEQQSEERGREEEERKEAVKRQEEELRRREERARREQEEAKREAEERQREREAEEHGREEEERQEAEKRQEEELRRREEQARREQKEAKRKAEEMQRERKAAARKDGERGGEREKEEKKREEREKEAKKARKKEQKKWQEDNSRREEQAKREQEEARRQVEERRRRQKEKEEDERGARKEGKRRIIAARKAWKI